MSASDHNAALLNRQLQQAVHRLEQTHRFQQLVHKLTGRCWDLCIDQVGNRLTGSSETCLKNCVGRFIDTSNLIANRLEDTVIDRLSRTQ